MRLASMSAFGEMPESMMAMTPPWPWTPDDPATEDRPSEARRLLASGPAPDWSDAVTFELPLFESGVFAFESGVFAFAAGVVAPIMNTSASSEIPSTHG